MEYNKHVILGHPFLGNVYPLRGRVGCVQSTAVESNKSANSMGRFHFTSYIHSFIHSFLWYMQNATIPCRSSYIFNKKGM